MRKGLVKTFVLLCLFAAPAMGQGNTCEDDNDGGPGDPFCEGNTDIPLDSGVSVLMGITILYGVKKFRDNKTKPEVRIKEEASL